MISYQINIDQSSKLTATGGDISAYITTVSEKSITDYFSRQSSTDALSLPKYQSEIKSELKNIMSEAGLDLLSFTLGNISIDYGSLRKNELARLYKRWEDSL